MGLLKKLLSPKNVVHSMVDPVGATVGTAVTGNTGLSSYYDPIGLTTKSGGGTDQAANDATGGSATGVDYFGDSSDPSFGSFSRPFTVEDFYNYADPGYAFQLQQGTQGLQNSAAVGGSALGGAALKDLLKYNQDYAGTAYNDAFNRYQVQQGNIFSRLSSLLQLGQNAAAGVGSQGTALAGNAGQATANAGSAYGAGIVGAGNNLGNGLVNYWLMNHMNQLNRQPAVMTGGP